MKYGFNYGLGGQGGFGGGSTTPPTQVPKVTSSIIRDDAPDGIIAQWDNQVQISSNLKDAITVMSDGISMNVTDVIYNPLDHSKIGIIIDGKFHRKNVVTWAYNDQHATEYIKGANGIEADNQTHSVTNNILKVTADETTHSADTIDHTADEAGINFVEVLDDPGFDDPSKWDETPANSWIVGNSKATCSAAGACYSAGFTEKDKTYDITVVIDPGAIINGRGLILRASYDQEVELKSVGTHMMTMTANNSNTYIILESVDDSGTLSFVGDVSYLSVRKRTI
jgi:hypothetical protein